MENNDYRLVLKDVSKSFGEVKALRDVDFVLGQNEVVGLLGDNGAGKSTLIKIITGYYKPTEGEIYFNGEKVEGLTVQKARDLGVETVYQERALADLQTLWRNIFMGRELKTSACPVWRLRPIRLSAPSQEERSRVLPSHVRCTLTLISSSWTSPQWVFP